MIYFCSIFFGFPSLGPSCHWFVNHFGHPSDSPDIYVSAFTPLPNRTNLVLPALGATSSSPARKHPVVPLLDKAALLKAVNEATAAAAAEKVASTRPAPAATVAGVVQKDTPVRTALRQAGSTLTADQILDTIDKSRLMTGGSMSSGSMLMSMV